jgi:mannose-6-phosphate isomerase-like protein (cupin superfamily)
MKIDTLSNMTGGWFVGDFSPSCERTKAAEVACKHYRAGDWESRHVHKIATEHTLVVSGTIKMNEREIHGGQIVTLLPGEPADFEALEDSITVVVKVPSVIGDKYPAPVK